MTKRIMVIDDEPDIRLYLAAAIEDAGFEPVAFVGDSLLASVDEQRPDLIVLDIMMPKRSGMSMYRSLRTSGEHRGIPVVVVSGMSSAADFAREGFRRLVPDESIPPPEGFLEKPVAPEALGALLRQILGDPEGEAA